MTALTHLPESTRQELGQGVYSLADLRGFLAFSGEPRDAEWARPWLTEVLNPVPHERYQPDYSFSDLISLFVVRELLKRGVKPYRIREAESFLRAKWNTDRPFLSETIQTDGYHVYGEDPEAEGIEAADFRGQR